MAKKDIDLQPTEGMVKAAQRGLDLRKEYGRGGTDVGVARARDIVNRKNLSPSTVKRMFSFFSRHGAQKTSGWKPGEENYPSAQFIAWLLWGGDPGFSWSKRKRDEIERASKKESVRYVENIKDNARLLFSGDLWDHYKNFDELFESYLDTMSFSDEELEEITQNMSQEEIEEMVYNWAYDWTNEDYEDQFKSTLDFLDSTYEEFRVHMMFNNWQNKPIQTTEKAMSATRFVNNVLDEYKSIDSVTGYLKNGKVIFKVEHHDATDYIEIVALQNGRPTKIVMD